MPAKKLKVEISDAEGNRYTVVFEGRVSREKILNLLDMVELLGGIKKEESEVDVSDEDSKYDLLYKNVKKHFPFSWFSSKDAQKIYEQKLNAPLSLSTVSTYLARMANRGILVRKGPKNNRRYKVALTPYCYEEDFIKSIKPEK